MFAREWKARCPLSKENEFIEYLNITGVKDTSSTPGFLGAQVLSRKLEYQAEVTLITYWDCLDSIKAFSGDDIGQARLYPEDDRFELDPDTFVIHYEVISNLWL
ncbi:MAG: heme-degrading monooxygenase HmoA [Oceanicoccus sp.]|jgi:heme-degrading monooxygenase HmoA